MADKRRQRTAEKDETVHPLVRGGVGLAVVLVLAFFTAYTHTVTRKARASFPDGMDTYYLPPEGALKVASLGYREALADLIWVKTVLYFGERATTSRDYRYLKRYLDAVLALNPRFRTVYFWAGGVTIYNLNRITNESVWTSIKYLEKGLKFFPGDWEILFSLANNYLRELKTDDPEQAARWRQKGANLLWKAAHLGEGPAYLHSLAAKVWSERGRWELAYRRLQSVYRSTDNEEVRESVKNRMAELMLTGSGQVLSVERIAARVAMGGGASGGLIPLAGYLEMGFLMRLWSSSKSRVERFTREGRRLKEEWQDHLSYVSFDLFVLLGSGKSSREVHPIGGRKENLAASDTTSATSF